MSYPGSKTAAGVAEQIISQMPRHLVYVEAFAGRGTILRRKLPARSSIAIDVDADAAAWLAEAPDLPEACHVIGGDAVLAIRELAGQADETWLLNCDPPYLASVRTRRLYRHEFDTPEQHAALLDALLAWPGRAMVSGYNSAQYNRTLRGWRKHAYTTSTRGGPRRELLWMNFPAGLPLHDVRFVGDGFRERERIKRKRARWIRRLATMPAAERQVIAEALAATAGGSAIAEIDEPGRPRRK